MPNYNITNFYQVFEHLLIKNCKLDLKTETEKNQFFHGLEYLHMYIRPKTTLEKIDSKHQKFIITAEVIRNKNNNTCLGPFFEKESEVKQTYEELTIFVNWCLQKILKILDENSELICSNTIHSVTSVLINKNSYLSKIFPTNRGSITFIPWSLQSDSTETILIVSPRATFIPSKKQTIQKGIYCTIILPTLSNLYDEYTKK